MARRSSVWRGRSLNASGGTIRWCSMPPPVTAGIGEGAALRFHPPAAKPSDQREHAPEERAHDRVGQDRQDECDDDRFKRMHEVRHDDLIDDVQRDGEQEYLADTLPGIPEQVSAMRRI